MNFGTSSLSDDDCDRVVCRCLNITEAEVTSTVVALGVSSLSELCQRTVAGTGCTACHAELRRLLEKHTYASSASPICSVK
jgi:bacterioferritin-associated ferredoxin